MKILYLSLLSFLFLSCESPQPSPKETPQQIVPSVEDEDLIYLEEMAKVPESPQPILVVMHGYGSNERDTLGWGKALSDRFFVVSVRAPIELGKDRYAWFGRGISDDKVVAANADKVITAIEGLPRTANSQGSGSDDVVKCPLFIAGFSQGGRMAIEVAKRAKPGLVQGVLAFSPATFKATQLRIPTFISHGRSDKVVPFVAIAPVVQKLIKDGSPVTFTAFDGRHSLPSDVLQQARRWSEDLLKK